MKIDIIGDIHGCLLNLRSSQRNWVISGTTVFQSIRITDYLPLLEI